MLTTFNNFLLFQEYLSFQASHKLILVMSVATYPGLLTHSLTLLPFNSPDPALSPPQAFLPPRLMFSSVHPPSHLSGLTPTSLGKPLATLTRPQPLLHFLLALLYFPAQHLSDCVWDTWFDRYGHLESSVCPLTVW